MARPNKTRQAILDAALDLAAERGISATTVDDIADRAGVAKGSLYYNFSGKDDLFAELFASVGCSLVPALDEALAASSGRGALVALVETLLRRMRENPQLAKLVASEIFRSDRSWAETVGAVRGQLLDRIARAVSQARVALRGERLDVASMSVLGAVLGGGLEWLLFEPDRELDDIADAVTTLVCPLPPAEAVVARPRAA